MVCVNDNWISVNKSLPNKTGKYFIRFINHDLDTTGYGLVWFHTDNRQFVCCGTVTHWQAVSESLKEQSNDLVSH